jgi:hypothetical protein
MIPHFTKNDETAIRNQWRGDCILNSFASNLRGVAISLRNDFEYKILNTKKDDCGNYQHNYIYLTLDFELNYNLLSV